MNTNQKAFFTGLTIALVSCVDSNDSKLSDPLVDFLLDSAYTISDPQAIDILDSTALLVEQDISTDCDAHFIAAMNLPKPDRITNLHCDYWSSVRPVWLEHSCSFELERDDAFYTELISHNGMVKFTDVQAIIKQQSDWFLPNDPTGYVGFHAEDDFEVFKDLKSGHIFIRSSQY